MHFVLGHTPEWKHQNNYDAAFWPGGVGQEFPLAGFIMMGLFLRCMGYIIYIICNIYMYIYIWIYIYIYT